MIEQDRELLCLLRIVNQSLAQSVVELLRTMEDARLSASGLRRVADDLEGLVVALRLRSDQLDNTIDANGTDGQPALPPAVQSLSW